MVRSTSTQIYRELKANGTINAQEFDIVDYLLRTGNKALTRRELEEGIGMRGSSVCGRVNSLINKKVLSETLQRKCKISGNTANPVYVSGNQGEIF